MPVDIIHIANKVPIIFSSYTAHFYAFWQKAMTKIPPVTPILRLISQVFLSYLMKSLYNSAYHKLKKNVVRLFDTNKPFFLVCVA